MSTHRAHSASRPWRKALTGLAIGAAGVGLAVAATAAPAIGVDQPEPTTPAQTATMPNPGPPNYPDYDPRYEVTRVHPADPVEPWDGPDATSVALGALGGIALAGAGLGITLGVQRRRDQTALHSA